MRAEATVRTQELSGDDAVASVSFFSLSSSRPVHSNSSSHHPAPDFATRTALPEPRPRRRHEPEQPPPSPKRFPAAEKVLQSFNTWAFKREQPSDPQLMLQIIADAMARREPVDFVLYWGKGPRCGLAEPDVQCLDYLAALGSRVRAVYEPGAAFKLVLTDTHAELNGHARETIDSYYRAVDAAARERGFATCRLSDLARRAATPPIDPADGEMPEDVLENLATSALKWYRGNGTAEEGALRYFRMNMVERSAVEVAFPRSIFITFNSSKLRVLFPQHLPIFYMYSLRRGFGVKPWFLPDDATPCDHDACQCSA
jgi:L-tyrosine isonitrile synthase